MDGNPQLEDGFIKIATEVWEALIKYRLSGEEMKCLMFIIRKTYGWNKKKDHIALSQFVQATEMVKPSVCRAIKNLNEKHIIIVNKTANKTITSYGFNKRYKTWKVLTKPLTLTKPLMSVSRIVNRSLTKKRHTIYTSTKDTTTIDKRYSRENGYTKKAQKIIGYLNKKKGSKYRDFDNILARLKSGATIKECIQVIKNKSSDPYFIDNPKYLNPETLFRKKNFDKYLNDIPNPLDGRVSKISQRNINTLENWEPPDER